MEAFEQFRQLVPQEHRDTVRYEHTVPASSWIGLFQWDGKPQIFFGDHTLGERGVEPAVGDQTYAVTFSFARLGFKMIGFIDSAHPEYAVDAPSASIVQFWQPLIHQIAWPPLAPPLSMVDFPLLVAFAPFRKRDA